MSKKTIYLIRHGQTDFNKQGIVQGSGVDSSLNEEGHAQARKFYEAYHHINFDKIYVTELQRTHQTVAPFKQKKYTPASNIYVDSPSALESGRVDTVIIMGAGYSDEILKTLRQSYPLIKHVAVLRDSHLEVVDA
jgi:bisphosphoglycerate-dependent phosphoglycerate mutase